jgi:imidazolonepropionase
MLITNIGQVVTNSSGDRGDLGLIDDAAIAIHDGSIAWVGARAEVPKPYRDGAILNAEGRAVLPGFVDAHTHLVFAGDRSDEFARRLRGESYEDILASGGGIHATVAATRASSSAELTALAAARMERMLRSGTTTVEVKSGYGLTTDEEMRLLQVAAEAGARVGEVSAVPTDEVSDNPGARGLRVEWRFGGGVGLSVVPTFLGAHVPDRGIDHADYVDLVVDEMLPRVAGTAAFCDVFVDRGAFTVADARRILTAAARMGMGLRLHAEQLTHTGAALLAAELGAASADHLDRATAEDAAALAAAGVVATLLPASSFSMRSPQAPGRMLWDAGVTVAIATDCNPGTSNVESMPLVIALACLEMGLTPEEAVWAATLGGARSLRLADRGRVTPGAVADLVILDALSYRHIPYRPGTDLVWGVVKAGRVVR